MHIAQNVVSTTVIATVIATVSTASIIPSISKNGTALLPRPCYTRDMTAIQTCQPRHQHQANTDQAYRQRIQVVLDYIEEHLNDAFTDSLCLDQLADLAGFSIYHFHRIFRAYVGLPLATYIRRLRFDRAARHLLETDWGVNKL